MRFYLEQIIKKRDELNKLDADSRGMQPKTVYDCYIALGVRDDSLCKKYCRNYKHKCRGHLIMFQIPEIVNGREIREH